MQTPFVTWLEDPKVSRWAEQLHAARLQAKALSRITLEWPDLSPEAAYAIQFKGHDLRRGDGEVLFGFKMGLTSEAKRQQMSIKDPLYGFLTRQMRVSQGAPFSLAQTPCGEKSIHPKAEPEIYFLVTRTIDRVLTVEEVPAYCEEGGIALEILDSRFEGFKYFSLPDVIADNASSSHFLLGDPSPLKGLPAPSSWKIEFFEGDELKESALGSAISGDPYRSISQLTELALPHYKIIPKGTVILAGAATAAIPLKAGKEFTVKCPHFCKISLPVAD